MRWMIALPVLLLVVILPLPLKAVEPSADRLVAGGDRHFPPYEFINADGQPDGFNIDLLQAIAKEMNLEVEIRLDAWERVRDALADGRIDLVTGMVRSAERETQFDFSITHAGLFYCLFVRAGSDVDTIDKLRGKEILVHSQAYSQEWLAARHITDRIIPVASPQEALQRLAQGRHDGAVIERLSALNLMAEYRIDTIVMAGPPLFCAPYAFAVRKGKDRLLAQLNEGIHRMHQSGVYEDLYRRWFSVADAHAKRRVAVRVGIAVLSLVVGLAVAVWFSNLALKRAVRRRSKALVKSENRFQELCDLLPQTVFETDADGRLTFLNRSGVDMLGLDQQTLLNSLHLSDFLPGEPFLQEFARTGDRLGKPCVVRGAQIDPFPALLYATTVEADGRPVGLRGLLVDITVQKELEKQVIEAQKMEALGRLASGVAHDFNNIVTGIAAYAHMIRDQPHLDGVVADSADKIITGCDRAGDLVRHFLITAGRRQPEKQPVHLGRVVNEVFKLLQPTYGADITFENRIVDGADAVWAEPALVFQVVMNLCVNGAQAMAGKGGSLVVGMAADAAQTAAASDPRVFYVTDSGPGIDPGLHDRIFEPFFTTRREDSGTGIGLFVVRQTLFEMGGRIRVESEPGKGATFIVHMPAPPTEAG